MVRREGDIKKSFYHLEDAKFTQRDLTLTQGTESPLTNLKLK